MMDYIDFTGTEYPAMPPEARVALIILKYAVLGITPRIIPTIQRDFDSPLNHVACHQGTDLCYLKLMAAQVGHQFYLEPDGLLGTTAYWGPEIKIGRPQPALSINMGNQTNVDSLNFQFDNAGAVQPYVNIQIPSTKFAIPVPLPSVSLLNPPLGRVPLIRNKFVQVPQTAHLPPTKALLRGLAVASKTSNTISASGTLDVLRYGRILKPRRLVGVRGAGIAFNGHYYVESVTHRLQPGQYKQDFSLSRNALVSLTSTVAT